MLNDTHEVKLRSMEGTGNSSPNEWKGTMQCYPQKGNENIPPTVPELLRRQGIIIGAFIFPSLWLLRLLKVIWVMATYFI